MRHAETQLKFSTWPEGQAEIPKVARLIIYTTEQIVATFHQGAHTVSPNGSLRSKEPKLKNFWTDRKKYFM